MLTAALWFAFLGGAVAWTARLLVSYPLVTVACDGVGMAPLHVVTAVTAAVAGAATIVGWRLARRAGRPESDDDTRRRRTRFMAAAGALTSALFLTSIVVEGATPVLQPDPCVSPAPPRPVTALVSAAGRLLAPTAAVAHDGGPAGPAGGGETRVWVAGSLALAAAVYARGLVRLRRRARRRGPVSAASVLAYAGGLVALGLALLSPLETASATLFSAHMAQHLVLVLIAPPLLVLGAPLVPLLWGLPRAARVGLGRAGRARACLGGVWRGLTAPPVATALHVVGVAAWHVPALYEAALDSPLLHALEHLTFTGTALLFWWSLRYAGDPGRAGHGVALLSVFALSLLMTALGALLTFAPTPWYAGQSAGASALGLTALEDQQLAGLIMWAPGGLVYAATACLLFLAWLRAAERRARRRDAAGASAA